MKESESSKGTWYAKVPKDRRRNVAFRRRLISRAETDKSLRRELWKACSEDVLFYTNAFCWTHDPRRRNSVIPFITYDYQDEAILELVKAITGGHDVGIVKSRDMGASWIILLVFEWFWHFSPAMLNFLMVSRNADLVDSRGDMGSLFAKIDFLHKHEPTWLLPKGRKLGADDPNRRMMHLGNAVTGSTIDGETTTGDVARGDRRTAILIDEFAAFEPRADFAVLRSTRDATRCRIFNSTPQGSGNAFAQVINDMPGVKVLRLHWPSHPRKNRGLYRSDEEGNLKLLDDWTGVVEAREKGVRESKMVSFPREYPFILDGKIRSPWYDLECARAASPQEIGQELDLDFMGSDYQFFDPEVIHKLKGSCAREPYMLGELEFDPESYAPRKFREDAHGCLRLWLQLGDDGRPDADARYVMGIDIATGTGASNSAAVVYDRKKAEKVAEYINPNILPIDFARVCFALGRFFNRARIVPDRTGPTGEVFVRKLIADGYGNIYYRRTERKVTREITNEPGVWLNSQKRTSILEEYRDALGTFKIINRSAMALEECLQFIRKMDGSIEHTGSVHAKRPDGARSAHGDLVIADALAWVELNEAGEEAEEPELDEIPDNCIGARLAARREQERKDAAVKERLGDGW